jgi:hypothetical protein
MIRNYQERQEALFDEVWPMADQVEEVVCAQLSPLDAKKLCNLTNRSFGTDLTVQELRMIANKLEEEGRVRVVHESKKPGIFSVSYAAPAPVRQKTSEAAADSPRSVPVTVILSDLNAHDCQRWLLRATLTTNENLFLQSFGNRDAFHNLKLNPKDPRIKVIDRGPSDMAMAMQLGRLHEKFGSQPRYVCVSKSKSFETFAAQFESLTGCRLHLASSEADLKSLFDSF